MHTWQRCSLTSVFLSYPWDTSHIDVNSTKHVRTRRCDAPSTWIVPLPVSYTTQYGYRLNQRSSFTGHEAMWSTPVVPINAIARHSDIHSDDWWFRYHHFGSARNTLTSIAGNTRYISSVMCMDIVIAVRWHMHEWSPRMSDLRVLMSGSIIGLTNLHESDQARTDISVDELKLLRLFRRRHGNRGRDVSFFSIKTCVDVRTNASRLHRDFRPVAITNVTIDGCDFYRYKVDRRTLTSA